MVEAIATARGIRTSAQKAGLVLELIRGKNVNQALATLQFTRKTIARDIAKVLRSAVANVQQQEAFSGDIDGFSSRRRTPTRGRRPSGYVRLRWGARIASSSAPRT